MVFVGQVVTAPFSHGYMGTRRHNVAVIRVRDGGRLADLLDNGGQVFFDARVDSLRIVDLCAEGFLYWYAVMATHPVFFDHEHVEEWRLMRMPAVRQAPAQAAPAQEAPVQPAACTHATQSAPHHVTPGYRRDA